MSNSHVYNRTPEMEEYEEKTGKLAVWKGKISKDFKKWQEKKKKEEIKREKEDFLSYSRKEKKEVKRELKEGKEVGKDYEHLIVAENLHKTYLLGTTAVPGGNRHGAGNLRRREGTRPGRSRRAVPRRSGRSRRLRADGLRRHRKRGE